jgi:hypothetical protein
VNFVLEVKFSVRPSILLNSRECSPLEVNEGVKLSPRGQISSLGAMSQVKNGPQDAEETTLSYEVEKKPLKLRTESPGEVDFLCELTKGRFSVTANVNHEGKLCTAKIFDKVPIL